MIRLIIAIIFTVLFFLNPVMAFANTNSFVSVVNPVRGLDFWQEGGQKPEDAVFGQMEILDKFNIPATWLVRYDVLSQTEIINKLKSSSKDEKGIFLEITPTFARDADVLYHKSENWHNAGSAFLSGYEREERIKFVDTAFHKFKEVFGFFPKSVGAWWVDAFSLSYMQEKYGVVSALIVADQYTTDNYQIWGQFWSTPYYPSKNNALYPAQTNQNKLPVVIFQWAARDPVNAYGKGVEESTFSVQANDYLDYHNLGIEYFSALVDIYTKQPLSEFGQLTVGLENSYSWEKYGKEYEKQIEVLVDKKENGQFSIVNMADFAIWYKNKFPNLSPAHIISADDPLGSFKKTVWFMNPYYRVGWFYNNGSQIKDIRQYIDGKEELCFNKRCDEVNFGTSATRVLDQVSFGHKWVIDEGKISDFKILKEADKVVIFYANAAGRDRKLEFLPRDISIDGKISSIDSAILNITKYQLEQTKESTISKVGPFRISIQDLLINTAKFLLFLTLGCMVPGFLLVGRTQITKATFFQKFFLSAVLGLVLVTLVFYFVSLMKVNFLIYLYFLINLLFLVKHRKKFTFKITENLNFHVIFLVILGTMFQVAPTFQSGLNFSYGLGFWGPNTHDGIWHISLINQLIQGAPFENPVFSGEVLKNYHFFYDLLVAVTTFVSKVPVMDLIFRFYPVLFSLLLGIGSYHLLKILFYEKLTKFQFKIASILGLYFVYFAGSFGWIVTFIKERNFSGESAFWANQSISFNLNPPFAISLLIIIAILQILFQKRDKYLIIILSLLSGSLIAFKAYGAVLILATFLIFGLLKHSLTHLLIFAAGSVVSALLYLLNFNIGTQVLLFSPFWFIHSMIDSPDRVGLTRLTLARESGLSGGNWFKYISSEIIGFLLFLFGNLGMRFFALLGFVKVKSIFRENTLLFIFIFSTLSFLIPLIFIQAGNPWNTIQFVYYFLYIASLISAVVLSVILTSFNKLLAWVVAFIILAVTPINSWATANSYLTYRPHAYISNAEIEALRVLRSNKNGYVLTFPYDEELKKRSLEPWPLSVYETTAYVSALSGKATFLEDVIQNQILLTDYKKRLALSKDFFSSAYFRGNQFLKENKIQYIYLPKIHNISLDEEKINIKRLYENKEVIIYEVL